MCEFSTRCDKAVVATCNDTLFALVVNLRRLGMKMSTSGSNASPRCADTLSTRSTAVLDSFVLSDMIFAYMDGINDMHIVWCCGMDGTMLALRLLLGPLTELLMGPFAFLTVEMMMAA